VLNAEPSKVLSRWKSFLTGIPELTAAVTRLEVLDADTAEVEIDPAEVGTAVTVDMDPAAAARETGRTAVADQKAPKSNRIRGFFISISPQQQS
jgi:hypothetical protein